MKNNHLDNFENFIKNSLSENEIPFNPSDWESLSQKMDLKKSNPFYKSNWFLAASVLIIATICTVAYLSGDNPKKEVATNNKVSSNEQNESTFLIDSNSNNNTQDIVELNHPSNNNIAEEEFLKAEKITETNTNTISETKELNDIESIDSSSIIETSNIEKNNRFESDSKSDHSIENIKVEPIEIPQAEFYTSQVDGCEGTAIQFTAEKQNNVDYLWKFDDGEFSNEMNPIHTYKKAGKYQATLIVRSNLDRSKMKKSIEQSIVIYPNPKINFDWELAEENGVPSVYFENKTEDGSMWNWNFGDGNKSQDKNPEHTYRKKGIYSVSLNVISEENCKSSLSKEITINNDYNLLAPNSFTPNGDGTNDYFIPAALNRLNCRFILTIYSARDGLIYETENVNQPWDGINQKTGERCKEGQYVWVVKLTNEKGEIENYKGALLLLK